MPTNKRKQSKIKFDNNWRCCSSGETDVNVMINTNSNGNQNWISIQLPHIIDKKDEETNHNSTDNKQNWWYCKHFEWKNHLQNSDQRVYLIFESLNDHNIDKNNNDYSSIDNIKIWLNQIQIFSDSFQPPKISIDLTEQLRDDSDENNCKNTLIICCTNASLSLHTYLLLPHDIAHAIKHENTDDTIDSNYSTLPFRKNRVLDYLVRFNDADKRFDIGFNPKLISATPSKRQNLPHAVKQEKTDGTTDSNCSTLTPRKSHVLDNLVIFNNVDNRFDTDFNPKLKSPTLLNHQNPSDIIVSEHHDQSDEQTVNNKENIEEIHVPRLNIVMLIVGTRGDVQPFVA